MIGNTAQQSHSRYVAQPAFCDACPTLGIGRCSSSAIYARFHGEFVNRAAIGHYHVNREPGSLRKCSSYSSPGGRIIAAIGIWNNRPLQWCRLVVRHPRRSQVSELGPLGSNAGGAQR